ncbi:MAG: helix-turn-helix domain-containing protein [Ruminococcaceae bacterium]|nr:helix-turn-helix domain-containing protein [Oscillospiraceae bacterium]
MARFITLSYFGASARRYHIYRIKGSTISHQPHYHNYYQVCFVISGEILHGQGKGAVTLAAGDAFIVPPGFVHSLDFGSKAAEVYSLAFEEALFAPGFVSSGAERFMKGLCGEIDGNSDSGVRLRVVLDGESCKSIRALLDVLMRQQKNDALAELSAAPSIIESVLYLLAQSYYSQPQNAEGLDRLMSYQNTLQRCISYIDAHFCEPLTLHDVAARFGLSRSSFCMIFPRFTGQPFRQYVAAKRIEAAQMLIRSHPERALSAIGREVGYGDEATFYRNFLRLTGMSPAKYRAINKA